tara:strand:+ start:174 stop:392 length:219 start_codon:yes stop_codon:yes gene_type:complete
MAKEEKLPKLPRTRLYTGWSSVTQYGPSHFHWAFGWESECKGKGDSKTKRQAYDELSRRMRKKMAEEGLEER